MEPIRIVIADDHIIYREGVRVLLGDDPALAVVGEADSGDTALTLALQLRPDVVLMDLKMPGLSGIEATRRLVEQDPAIRVLVVTMFDDDDTVFAAMRAGARGYLLKDADQEEMGRAIRAVQRGEAIFGPAIAARMGRYFAGLAQHAAAAPFPALTEREREILALIARGHPNAVIANRLALSLKTVQNYVSAIFAKLQVADRAEAMLRARDAGMG